MTALLAVGAVTLGTLGLGAWGVRFVRTTSDLLVASRAVTAWWNAAAISGEYLSAASFLGIAGLELKLGASALWQALGFTAGYLALLLFVAAPLRRFGSYTIPDFAEARLRSPRLRMLAAAVVIVIGCFYLVPQLKGAGLALNVVVGAPYWVGVFVVAAIVAINVAIGGMRGITYVQAFQFWVKVFAVSVPIIVLLIHFGGLPGRSALFGDRFPHAGRHGLTVKLAAPQQVDFPAAGSFTAGGHRYTVAAGRHVTLPAGRIRLPPGGIVPMANGIPPERGTEWSRPVGGSGEASPLLVYSLLIATFLGTMGLPHILVRFYTNPDGHAARHTTVRVLSLLGLFYLFPAFYGALGRALTPQLYVTGQTDDVVLRLPQAAWPGPVGTLLGALVAAGAFAAFLSTSSGLLVSLAGTLSHDVWPRVTRGKPSGVATRRRWFRIAAVGAIIPPAALGLAAQSVDISILVGWAFAIAASTFCPMFLLGIWWTRLTARGAAAGMVAGMVIATAAILTGLAVGEPDTGAGALLAQPAVASVPIAFLTMVVVSLRDPRRLDPAAEMLALHAPEGLGLRLADESAPSGDLVRNV
ncbi:MAG TPA: cation acetate symporter [Solirubrobacteraceae bacterium]|jgi:Na+(H+)/acetate symporter ActP|nr:cation acetate symporter [Solirubrobacteraceae bacterium]